MQQVGISSFQALSNAAGVSERQIRRLRRGELPQMRVETLLKLSKTLQISLSALIANFATVELEKQKEPSTEQLSQQIAQLKQECDRRPQHSLRVHVVSRKSYGRPDGKRKVALRRETSQTEAARAQQQLDSQRDILLHQFQQKSLDALESLLLQFPTAAHKAREQPSLTAVKILPLIEKPLKTLLLTWGIEEIATVGTELAYNPQLHQLISGNAQPGELVKIRYTGYRQGNKLLYKAKVSPVSTTSANC